VELVLSSRARPPLYAIDESNATASRTEIKECVGWYQEVVSQEASNPSDRPGAEAAGSASSAAGTRQTSSIHVGELAGGLSVPEAIRSYAELVHPGSTADDSDLPMDDCECPRSGETSLFRVLRLRQR